MTIDQFVDRVNSNLPTDGVRVDGDFSVFAKTGVPFYVTRTAETATGPSFYQGKDANKYLSPQLMEVQLGMNKNWKAISVFNSEGEFGSVMVNVPAKTQNTTKTKKGTTTSLPQLGGPQTATIKKDGVKGFIESSDIRLDGAEILIPFEAFTLNEYKDVNIANISVSVAETLMDNDVTVDLSGASIIGAWKAQSDEMTDVWLDYFILEKKPDVLGDNTFEDLENASLKNIDQALLESYTQDAQIVDVISDYSTEFIGSASDESYALVEYGNDMNQTQVLVKINPQEENLQVNVEETKDPTSKRMNTMIIYGVVALGIIVVLVMLFRKK